MSSTLPHDAELIASTLRCARAAAGLSLRELGLRAQTSHATLHAYEQGKKAPNVLTFLRILNAAGFAIDFELSRRIRRVDNIDRGHELEQALALAGEFPAKHRRHMAFPVLKKLLKP
jgi:transcriptional regulator with XRE-family HTH domain